MLLHDTAKSLDNVLCFHTGTDVILSGVSPGSNNVLMRSVNCYGNETNLFQCVSVLVNGSGCNNNIVGIQCTNKTGKTYCRHV